MLQNTTQNQCMTYAMDSIERTAEHVIQYFDGEQREEQLRKLKEQMKTLCHVDIQYQDATASLKVVQDTLKKKKEKRKRKENFMEVDDDSDDDEAADKEINIQELYKKKMEERSSRRSNINNHSRYITFKNNIERILKQVDVDIDEDIAITESDVNTIDPITKRPIQDPVRIRLCGHVFDRMSIMSILKGKHNIRCPIPGCVQNRVTLKDIEDHHAMKGGPR